MASGEVAVCAPTEMRTHTCGKSRDPILNPACAWDLSTCTETARQLIPQLDGLVGLASELNGTDSDLAVRTVHNVLHHCPEARSEALFMPLVELLGVCKNTMAVARSLVMLIDCAPELETLATKVARVLPESSAPAELLRLAFHITLTWPSESLWMPVTHAMCTCTDLRAAHYAAAALLQLGAVPHEAVRCIVPLICRLQSETVGIDADDTLAVLFALVHLAASDEIKRHELVTQFGLGGNMHPADLPMLMCGAPQRARIAGHALYALCNNNRAYMLTADLLVQYMEYGPCAGLFAELGIPVDPRWLVQHTEPAPTDHADDEREAERVARALMRLNEIGVIRTDARFK